MPTNYTVLPLWIDNDGNKAVIYNCLSSLSNVSFASTHDANHLVRFSFSNTNSPGVFNSCFFCSFPFFANLTFPGQFQPRRLHPDRFFFAVSCIKHERWWYGFKRNRKRQAEALTIDFTVQHWFYCEVGLGRFIGCWVDGCDVGIALMIWFLLG